MGGGYHHLVHFAMCIFWFIFFSIHKGHNCHPAPYYLNSDKPFLTLSNQYHKPKEGFELGSSSECLLEFDTCSKLLGHHGRFKPKICVIKQ